MVLLIPSMEAFQTLIDTSFKFVSLKLVVEAVYLGHTISSNLKDDSDVYKQVKKLNRIGYVPVRKFASCSVKV